MKKHSTLLIADDQKHMLALLRTILSGLGYRILTALSGEEALIQADTTPIDLLLIDFEMSGLTGVQTVQQLKASPRYAQLPVVMITGRGQSAVRVEAMRAGVTLVISKPFSPAELVETVRRFLGESETVGAV